MSGAPSDSLRLTRSMRVKQGRDFQGIRTEGQRIAQGCLILNWRPRPAGAAPRLGVITSRKIGDSPARSRARRLLREAFRLNQHALPAPTDIVLVARQSITGKKLAEVTRDYLTALRRGGVLAARS